MSKTTHYGSFHYGRHRKPHSLSASDDQVYSGRHKARADSSVTTTWDYGPIPAALC